MFSEQTLVVRSLKFYWRTNLAVLLGVIAGTAVIAGAFITGDSVRDSLRRMSLERLGRIDFALHGPRFLPQSLGEALAQAPSVKQVSPAILLPGSLEHTVRTETRRVSSVRFHAIDSDGWNLLETADLMPPSGTEIVLNSVTAKQLDAAVGDDVSVWLQKPEAIPGDSLLGEREETTTEMVMTVSGILPVTAGAGRLSLQPGQQVPRVAYLNLEEVQDRLEVSRVRATRRNPVSRPARVNTFFVEVRERAWAESDQALDVTRRLNVRIRQTLDLEDLGLKLDPVSNASWFSLTSESMLLERTWSNAASRVAEQRNIPQSPVLVYLANQIRQSEATRIDEASESGYSMYSVVAGLDLEAEGPFGDYPVVEGSLDGRLADDEIVLNAWLAEDLKARVGDVITIDYHVVGSHGELPEESRDFRVKAVLAMEQATVDRFLVPQVPGITDIDSIDDWEQPFPMKLGRVTARDDDYWTEYRALPKAFIGLQRAQELWNSRYGNLTSFRFGLEADDTTEQRIENLREAMLSNISLPQSGLVVQPVKYNGLAAAVGANDFSQLFIAFSFFLIFSAAILIGLLFRLGIERRSGSIGLLSALGFPPGQVRRQLFREALMLVGLGGVLGCVAAVAYGALMVHGLTTWWLGAIGTTSLTLSISAGSLVSGFGIAVLVTGTVSWWALRQLSDVSARSLLHGEVRAVESRKNTDRQRRRNRRTVVCSLAAGMVLIAASVSGLVPTTEAFSGFSWQVVAFFLVGLLLLCGSLAGLGLLLSPVASNRSGWGALPLARIGLRNAVRNRSRSVSTAGLIAFASFVIVAVAAGHRNPTEEFPDRNTGNGGFSLVGETSQPILYDLNSASGRESLNLDNSDKDDARLIESMFVEPFRVKPGEDSSCLNLYRTRLPTLLGVPASMIERGGFKFADTRSEHPWELLNQSLESPDDVPHVPVLGDLNTLQYGLKMGIGDTLAIPNEDNPSFRLQVVGMFDASIFQGVLLVSEQQFNRMFTQEPAGYRYFLIGLSASEFSPEKWKQQTDRLSELLEDRLNPFGFDSERVSDRLAAFLEVQNTYLSTFQALGSLGLLLGTLGLSTVMLRNVLERRSELALMRAVGFTNRAISRVVLSENALLLVWGLAAGSVSALVAMFPHLLTTGADVPWWSLLSMLIAITVVGMLAALLAVTEAVRTPIVSTLRGD